jgi:hypothetical protein
MPTSKYAQVVKSAAEVETTKNRIVQYGRKCVFLGQEPDEAESEDLVKAHLKAVALYEDDVVRLIYDD